VLAVAAGCSKTTEPAAQATPAAQPPVRVADKATVLNASDFAGLNVDRFQAAHPGAPLAPSSVDGSPVPGVIEATMTADPKEIAGVPIQSTKVWFTDGEWCRTMYFSDSPSSLSKVVEAYRAVEGTPDPGSGNLVIWTKPESYVSVSASGDRLLITIARKTLDEERLKRVRSLSAGATPGDSTTTPQP